MKNLLFFWMILITSSLAIHPDALISYEAILKKSLTSPTQQNTLELARLASIIRERLNRDDPKEIAFLEEIQKALRLLPEHAQYLEDQILMQRQEVIEKKRDWHDYNENAVQTFQILRNIQSPQSVRVLCGMLDDKKGSSPEDLFPGQTMGDAESLGLRSNSQSAVSALENLGIENPPLIGARSGEHSVRWRDWWDEIKTGKKTYRFIGSPIEYGLNGPLSTKEMQRREHERQREDAFEKSPISSNKLEEQGTETKSQASLIVTTVVVIASFLLLIAGWRAFSKSRLAK